MASPDEAQEKEDDDDDSGSDPDMESLESNQGKQFQTTKLQWVVHVSELQVREFSTYLTSNLENNIQLEIPRKNFKILRLFDSEQSKSAKILAT